LQAVGYFYTHDIDRDSFDQIWEWESIILVGKHIFQVAIATPALWTQVNAFWPSRRISNYISRSGFDLTFICRPGLTFYGGQSLGEDIVFRCLSKSSTTLINVKGLPI
jgi:hypothetical protein